MAHIQRRVNIDAMSRRCIDVDSALSQCCVLAGKLHVYAHIASNWRYQTNNIHEDTKSHKTNVMRNI